MDIPEELYLQIFKHVPVLAVDGIIVKDRQILLAKRTIEPFLGFWCLPGGRMNTGETCEEAVVREMIEETGLKCEIIKLLGVYSRPGRDPRGHTVTVAYLLKPVSGELKGNFESSELKFFDLDKIPTNLGFDHRTIIKEALSILNT
ncbi:NUDIX hydrolase [Candidatus Microgenomates bacterium]|nr:NUDIX hydrolase [Candidatus Microgenomates bacterium]